MSSSGQGADHPGAPYGRVTDPARYSALHDAADELLERLERQYQVERTSGGAELDPQLAGSRGTAVVRLRPLAESAGALTVVYTDLPGLYVRLGDWHVEVLPRCGCDACDEDPNALVDELRRKATHLVAGEFQEELTGWPRRRLTYRFPDSAGWTLLDRGGPYGRRRAVRRWQPWTPR
ncbi:MAG TPA: DUF6226 family protein [Acidimicrobiales bacterium]|nr:DUF6226 family protein [Acidimicrobiales bacterium]